MAGARDKSYELADDSSNAAAYPFDEKLQNRPSRLRRFLDSFKPNSNATISPHTSPDSGGNVYDVEAAAAATAQSPLARKLKGRHLQMIAIGGSIGILLLLCQFILALTILS
jgi:amino acid permease